VYPDASIRRRTRSAVAFKRAPSEAHEVDPARLDRLEADSKAPRAPVLYRFLDEEPGTVSSAANIDP